LYKIRQEKPLTEKIVIYTDSCGAQNKNSILSNMLLHFARTTGIEIEQRFLVVGHTHLEADTFHSNIEHAIKDCKLYTPMQYVKKIVGCRHMEDPKATTVCNVLSHDFFKEYHYKYMKSIRPGSKKGDPTVNNVRGYWYKPTGSYIIIIS